MVESARVCGGKKWGARSLGLGNEEEQAGGSAKDHLGVQAVGAGTH